MTTIVFAHWTMQRGLRMAPTVCVVAEGSVVQIRGSIARQCEAGTRLRIARFI